MKNMGNIKCFTTFRINDYISKYGYEKYKNITSDSGHETKKINYVMKNLHTVL